jgi:hypothetical protein
MDKEKQVSKDCNTGLDDRCRDDDGSIRRKRGDTLVGTLRQEYGEDFARGARGDMRLDTLLEQAGVDSLSEYLRRCK